MRKAGLRAALVPVLLGIGTLACGNVVGGETNGASGGGGSAGSGGGPGGNSTGSGGASGGGIGSGGGHVVPPHQCVGACCPTDPTCAVTSADYSGPECLAQFDNTVETRWQFRQAWSHSSLPLSLDRDPIATVWSMRSQLTWPACNMSPADLGTQMALLDVDVVANVARLGFSRFTSGANLAADIGQGLCMVADTYDDPSWFLAGNVPVYPGWPLGLPIPMQLPWTFAPARAKGLSTDFDFAAERIALLSKLHSSGEYGAAGYTGVFYFDRSRGYLHAFAPVSYAVDYDSAQVFTVAPIREAEVTMQMNDPAHPNCAGAYRGDALDPAANCAGSTGTPAWGCTGSECPIGEGPSVTRGYLLITELEQVYNALLGETLCALYMSGVDSSWTAQSCRAWPGWDPMSPSTGLPKGDWCAITNSPATTDCHDAFQSVSYATYQGFRVQSGTCTAQ